MAKEQNLDNQPLNNQRIDPNKVWQKWSFIQWHTTNLFSAIKEEAFSIQNQSFSWKLITLVQNNKCNQL